MAAGLLPSLGLTATQVASIAARAVKEILDVPPRRP